VTAEVVGAALLEVELVVELVVGIALVEMVEEELLVVELVVDELVDGLGAADTAVFAMTLPLVVSQTYFEGSKQVFLHD